MSPGAAVIEIFPYKFECQDWYQEHCLGERFGAPELILSLRGLSFKMANLFQFVLPPFQKLNALKLLSQN
jgi:hypothetical protein